jgi:hypothetical protein
MDWIQVVTIIGSLGGIMIYMLQRLEKDFDRVNRDIDKINTNMDAMGRRLDGHATRIDQLYKMFVDLLAKK